LQEPKVLVQMSIMQFLDEPIVAESVHVLAANGHLASSRRALSLTIFKASQLWAKRSSGFIRGQCA
jgi:hypothetical protein